MSAYSEGYKVGRQLLSVEMNPYANRWGPMNVYGDWLRGWQQGQADQLMASEYSNSHHGLPEEEEEEEEGTDDDAYNDPRTGQAAGINRDNRGRT